MASLDVAIGPNGEVAEVNRISVDPVSGWGDQGYELSAEQQRQEDVREAQIAAADSIVFQSPEEPNADPDSMVMRALADVGDVWTSPTPTQAIQDWMNSVNSVLIDQPSGVGLLPGIAPLPVVSPVTVVQLVDPPPGSGIAVIPDGIFRGVSMEMLVTQPSGRVVLGTAIRNRQKSGVRMGILPQVVFENEWR